MFKHRDSNRPAEALALEQIGHNLRYIRDRIYGMSQVELAKRLNVSPTSWGEYERGKTAMKIDLASSFLCINKRFHLAPAMLYARWMPQSSAYSLLSMSVMYEVFMRSNANFVDAWLNQNLAGLMMHARASGQQAMMFKVIRSLGKFKGDVSRNVYTAMDAGPFHYTSEHHPAF